MAATARHETRALLRAHLSAASGHRHRTRHCPICHRLLRLVTESAPTTAPEDPEDATEDERPSA
ncbi:DUF6274 family protein [Streptomyces sp. Qhu-G9]|uniref:DUF6274 family protein n=1 Tax=Streptomyces sp. Qhu-G9 TaxID=3452799 RepID=UPI0022AC00CA|nr:DUF6274 family protein [Streptomyces aurantiacus]WAU85918.1 DUF6274 family protein [Streptomyces aurantiacus]